MEVASYVFWLERCLSRVGLRIFQHQPFELKRESFVPLVEGSQVNAYRDMPTGPFEETYDVKAQL